MLFCGNASDGVRPPVLAVEGVAPCRDDREHCDLLHVFTSLWLGSELIREFLAQRLAVLARRLVVATSNRTVATTTEQTVTIQDHSMLGTSDSIDVTNHYDCHQTYYNRQVDGSWISVHNLHELPAP